MFPTVDVIIPGDGCVQITVTDERFKLLCDYNGVLALSNASKAYPLGKIFQAPDSPSYDREAKTHRFNDRDG